MRFDSDGCALAGTSTEAANPVAAALLITGSGRTDRDSDARLPGGLKLRAGITKAVAEALAAAHVSALRYDKRGVGRSGGDYYSVGMAQRLTDARAGLDWLAARTGGLPLLAIGHSEGAYHAGQLAADNAVAGAVLLAGSAQPGGEVLSWQTRQLAARLPASARLILRIMRTDVIKSQRKNQDRIMASSADVIRIQGQRINARWFRDFVAYDPAPVLARITVPILAITGGHDLQVPPEDIEAIGHLVKGDFEGRVVGDLSHLLRPDPDSVGPRGYRQAVRQPVSPEILRLITSWLASQWGQGTRTTRTRGGRVAMKQVTHEACPCRSACWRQHPAADLICRPAQRAASAISQ
ncbi:MAG: alpha/beta hydrolase [Streptosporangiaceae bacterium]